MIKIAIDARMINHSGIGTYMKNLLNVLIEDYHLKLLGNSSEIQKHIKNSDKVEIIEFNSPIYSISEQIIFPVKIPACDLFLSPHYNIPLAPIRAKKRIVIINDANHLAFYNLLSLKQKLYSKFMMKAAVYKSDKIIAISEFTKSEILKYLTVDNEKIKVVHFGIDSEKIESELHDSLSIKSIPAKYLLYVGNIKPHKNLINLLKAFEIILSSHNDYKLIIVGKKEGFITGDNEVFKIVENNSLLKANIIFTGYIENRELYNYYKSSSIFVFPSLYEGFGIPPLEAMICECPVVASNITAIPEICGDAILYVNPMQPEDIAEKVNTLIENRYLREELIKKGKLQITKFSLAKFSYNLKEVIKEVINKDNS
jgi:glycosyltransferase involved in cell wall biosynthesis